MTRHPLTQYYLARRCIEDMQRAAPPGTTPWPIKAGNFFALLSGLAVLGLFLTVALVVILATLSSYGINP